MSALCIMVHTMRLMSIIVLTAMSLMVLAPAASVTPYAGHAAVSIQTLDVCHGSASGINIELPCSIHECPCSQSPLKFSGIRKTMDATFTPLFLSFQDERPPQA